MSTPDYRAALERWRDLAQTDLLCPANPAETDWGAVVVAITATRAALAQPEAEGPSERIISIAKAVQEHAFSWEPDARLIGNVCAEDVADLCGAILATPPAPRPEGDWFAVAVVAQDMRSRGLAEQACGEELLKLANSNRSQPARPAAPPTLPANYIDREHQGEDLEMLQTFYQACSAEGGTADEIHLRGLRAVLAACPTAPPAPEPGEVVPTDDAWWDELVGEIARVQHVAFGEGQGPRFDLAKAVGFLRPTAPPAPEPGEAEA
jgi:hypothetical protein